MAKKGSTPQQRRGTTRWERVYAPKGETPASVRRKVKKAEAKGSKSIMLGRKYQKPHPVSQAKYDLQNKKKIDRTAVRGRKR